MLKKVFLTGCVVCVLTGLAFAQATGRITGRVLDQAGAVLPGATVTVTETGTGVARDTVTNGEGLYTVPALNPGTYSVKAELTGFAPQTKSGIVLLTAATITADMQLGLAQLQENVTVTGASPLVETTQATPGNAVQQREVEALPMLNRTVAAVMILVPGAREVTRNSTGSHGQSDNNVSFGGGGGTSYNSMVDGLDNKEDSNGGTLMSYSLEGVQEFKVLTAGSNAEYGRASATVLLTTKSGGNATHGTIFGYGRNEKLIATDYFSKPENGGLGKQPFSRAQYGGSLGGALVQNRIFYFGSVERIAQEFTQPRPIAYYNELEILMKALPNLNATNSHSILQPSRNLFGQAKVNFQLGNNHSTWVRYSSENGYIENGQWASGAAGLAYSPYLDHSDQSMWGAAGSWAWTLNSTTVNQFSAQYLKYEHDTLYPQCVSSPIYLGVDLGASACLPQKLTFPSVQTGQIQIFSPGWVNLVTKLELKDDFSKQLGRHAIKFGASYMFTPIHGGVFGGGSPGSIVFFHDPSTIVNNTNGLYPQGFQTPGIVRQINVTSQTIGDYSSDPKPTSYCQQNLSVGCARPNWGSPLFNLGTYVQDDFRISPRVTLNLGLRYDLYDYIGVDNIPNNRAYQVLKAIGSPYGRLPELDKKNFGPRVGGAWDVHGNGKDVVRASYGIFYLQGLHGTYFNRNYISKPILFVTQTTTDTAIGVGPLANFVFGQTPLPKPELAPTQLPFGGRSAVQWYDPDLRNQRNHQSRVGWSHLFRDNTVVSVDYSHVLGHNGWRNIDINPLINGVRPLSALTQAVYGDPNLLSTVVLAASVNRSLYDEVATHFEHRFANGNSFQVNYTLAWARGMGGTTEAPSSGGGGPFPQVASATGGNLDAPWEWGPSQYDERHRIVAAGALRLPGGIELAPTVTFATARPYTQFRAQNPSGDGSLQILCPSGNSSNVGFGVGQVPCGINNARGDALYNTNLRATKHISFTDARRLSVFAEFYNLFNHTNFGNQYFGNAFSPSTYGKPSGFVGGSLGSISTLPNSFQAQFGARFSF